MYQDISRAKFVLEVKCVDCSESEQEPLTTLKAVELPGDI